MKNKKYQKWMLTYAAIGVLVGTTITQLINGDLNLSGLLGTLTAALILFAIDIIRIRKKKDKTPDFDERTISNMQKFYLYSSNIFMVVIFLSLAVITAMGIEQITISYIWIFVFSYFSISGIGALIVSKR
ncbi:hypothetical protein [Virgibacillus salexigens]|uniref:hypothetical protein n=1 Tax=Virgibacillus salexigens TaxID=61016 RepID=UPI00190B9F3C|nr:hypothetical protein [Virgibacillus salexigens]